MLFMPFAAYAAGPAPVGSASNGGAVPSTCDPGQMQALERQSAMQSQQDVETVQNMLPRPDSVLEYTCFDQYVSVTAVEAGSIFTDANLDIDLGGLFGDAFFNALANGVLSAVLSKLTPDELRDLATLMSGLNAANLFLHMSPAERAAMFKNMSIDVQIQLRDEILAELPEDAIKKMRGDPTVQTLEIVIDNLPPEYALPLSSEELENMLAALPAAAVDALLGSLPLSLGIGLNFDDKKLDRSLESTILVSLKAYTDANFGGNFLGGRISVNYSPSANVGSGRYNCDRMNAVWQMAHCQNFQADPAQDGFKTLADYAGGSDPRRLPEACPKSKFWDGQYTAAQDDWKTDAWKENKEPSFVPESNGDDCSKAKIIKGADIVDPANGEVIPQYTCSAPGCTYKDNACVKSK